MCHSIEQDWHAEELPEVAIQRTKSVSVASGSYFLIKLSEKLTVALEGSQGLQWVHFSDRLEVY